MLATPPAAVASAWNAVESAFLPFVVPRPDANAVHSPNFAGPLTSGPWLLGVAVVLAGVLSTTVDPVVEVGAPVVAVVCGWSPAAVGRDPEDTATAIPPPSPVTAATVRTARAAGRCRSTETSKAAARGRLGCGERSRALARYTATDVDRAEKPLSRVGFFLFAKTLRAWVGQFKDGP
jgi:hypothetical protein